MATAQKFEEGVTKIEDDFLTCGICIETFKKPKMLHCLHTYCDSCLKPLVRQRGIECPVCRYVTHLPQRSTDGLPNDFRITQLQEALKDMQIADQTVLCEICKFSKKHEEAIKHCVNCLKNLCYQCSTDHKMNMHFSSHTIVNLESQHELQCPEHGGEPPTAHCMECRQPVCIVCLMTKCSKHKTESLDMAIQKAQNSVKTCAEQLKNITSERKIFAQHLTEVLRGIRLDVESIERDIKENTYKIIIAIQQKEQALIKKLNEEIDTFTKAVIAEVEKYNSLQATTTEVVHLSETSEISSNAFHVLDMWRTLKQKAESTKQNVPEKVKCPKFGFTPSDIGQGLIEVGLLKIDHKMLDPTKTCDSDINKLTTDCRPLCSPTPWVPDDTVNDEQESDDSNIDTHCVDVRCSFDSSDNVTADHTCASALYECLHPRCYGIYVCTNCHEQGVHARHRDTVWYRQTKQ